MRTTKVLSITLPEPMLEEMQKLAKQENRTMSELVREALREYREDRYWKEIQAYARPRAEAAGIRNEDDVVRAVRDFRREQRARRKRKSAA